jgi:hypothetical protein
MSPLETSSFFPMAISWFLGALVKKRLGFFTKKPFL